jgi:hypothetical protein
MSTGKVVIIQKEAPLAVWDRVFDPVGWYGGPQFFQSMQYR